MNINSGALTFSVDGKLQNIDAFTVRNMNFGQNWRSVNVKNRIYSLEIGVVLFNEVFSNRLLELISDAIEYPEDKTEVENKLELLGWPTDVEVLNENQVLKEMFINSMDLDFLNDLEMKIIRKVKPSWVLNSVQDITLLEKDKKVLITGCCASLQSLSTYQDY